MKIAFFSMVKNEESLAKAHAEMLREFADYAFVLDHESTDLTSSIIRDVVPSVNLYRLESDIQPQAEVTTFFAKKIFRETDADFLVLVDSDEFLSFRRKFDLERYLSDKEEFHAVRMCWENIFPVGPDFAAGFLTRGMTSDLGKVILSRKVLELSSFRVVQGSHAVTSSTNVVNVHEDIENCLYHIPITSTDQFLFKLIKGVSALKNDRVNRGLKQGFHWVVMAKSTVEGGVSEDDLKEMVFTYGGTNPSCERAYLLDFDFPYLSSGAAVRRDCLYYLTECLDVLLLAGGFGESDRSSLSLVKDSKGVVIYKFRNRSIERNYPVFVEWAKRLFGRRCMAGLKGILHWMSVHLSSRT